MAAVASVTVRLPLVNSGSKWAAPCYVTESAWKSETVQQRSSNPKNECSIQSPLQRELIIKSAEKPRGAERRRRLRTSSHVISQVRVRGGLR